jgi:predicted nucleic acid-binding protein
MITAVDTSVLLDVFLPDPRFEQVSATAMRKADAEGALVLCEVVYAELASQFPHRQALDHALEQLDIRFESISRDIAFAAGRAFRLYRERGGSRSRILSDFLIGAHAQASAGRLLSRDRGFYRAYFRDLVLLNPASPAKKG